MWRTLVRPVTWEGVTTGADVRTSGTNRRGRPLWIETVEAASIFAFVVCWGVVGARILEVTPSERLLWIVPLSLALGLMVADFVGGAVHWFADTYFDPETPILGAVLIEPFRDHHQDPAGITRHGFLELLGNNAMGTLPMAGILLALGPPASGLWAQLGHSAVAALALALFATNAFHCWAHMEEPPGFAAWLQRRRLVLSPEVHSRHHCAAHDSSYCVTSGWLNPLLDRWRFFGRLEALLSTVAQPVGDLGEDRDRDLGR